MQPAFGHFCIPLWGCTVVSYGAVLRAIKRIAEYMGGNYGFRTGKCYGLFGGLICKNICCKEGKDKEPVSFYQVFILGLYNRNVPVFIGKLRFNHKRIINCRVSYCKHK